MSPNAYRYPSERIILMITLLLIFILLTLVAGPTICLLPLMVGGMILLGYWINQNHHQSLMQNARAVTPTDTPELSRLVQQCSSRLAPGAVEVYVVSSRARNAYTFGFSSPRVVVLFSSLFRVMDEAELRFIIGHEMGHVVLGHTWLNTLLGGMAGVPLPFGAAILLIVAFRWWNRACEYSADRAGLIACGSLQKATSALVKLVADNVQTQAELQRALEVIDREDDSLTNILGETLSTHPMTIRRIEELRRFAASPEYQRTLRA